ncbi:nucleoside/nucleotide kinase family protein [Salinicola aestuarinus]|uniref:nucleoside/nucleotide kinase family protein n=1 Tax=Salinicola aestuarinus TaxID=1949082 RepID=UPI000DA1C909|nr:nucleoside/nucleotide kinase family protein [Salinicola aestuarinus]
MPYASPTASTAASSADVIASITLDPAIVTAARRLASGGQRRILGIAGSPGAGKSTLAGALAAALGKEACVLPMDGFHLANRQLGLLGRAARKGAPDTFDVDGYRSLLARLCDPATSAQTLFAPDFCREIEEPIAASLAVDPDVSLVITEGNYLLLEDSGWGEVRESLDAVWFVEIDTAIRESRLVARHQRFGRSEREAREWVATTDQPNAVRIDAAAHRADQRLTWRDRHLMFVES